MGNSLDAIKEKCSHVVTLYATQNVHKYQKNDFLEGMALVYKAQIQGVNDNTAILSHNHPYISICKLKLTEFLLQPFM